MSLCLISLRKVFFLDTNHKAIYDAMMGRERAGVKIRTLCSVTNSLPLFLLTAL